MGNSTARPLAAVSVCDARSIVTVAFSASANSSAWTSRGTITGTSEFLSEFWRKMSANEVLTTARKPNCVSAQGACSREAATPEIIAGQQDRRALRARLVQDEIRLRAALGVVAPVVEELVAEPRFGDRLEEPRRNDLVGVDVIDRQRYEAAFELLNNFMRASWDRSPARQGAGGGGERAGQERRPPCPAGGKPGTVHSNTIS